MLHTRQTQVLEDQSQSLPSSTLHPHHPHTTIITPQSLSVTLSLTMSIHHNPTTRTRLNNNITISLTLKTKRGHLCATPRRRKCLKPRVGHSLWQICIHTIHTQVTSHYNHSPSLSHTLTLSIHRNTTTNTTSTTITKYHSQERVREVSCAPHPADASA